jgi:hypothetical protein
MFAVGDIVRIHAPTVGYKKYHLCIKISDGTGAARFIFMNSDPSFDNTFSVPCARIPCIPPSSTGVTVFSFGLLPIYNDRQLKLFNAIKLGELALDVAQDVRAFANGIDVLTRPEKRMVIDALDIIIASHAPTPIVAAQAKDSAVENFDATVIPASA